jgi:Protein of unknown function (DUF3027)
VIVSPTTTRQAEPDQACAEAVDLARAAAAADAAPSQVGAHVGTEVEGDRVVTHLFESLNPGYVGWYWAVTVTRASRSKTVTVSESVLLPGPHALLAPDWVPWTERVRPGDLKAGDLLPAKSDDDRLVPLVAIAGDAGLLDWDENDAWRLPELGDAAGASGDTGSGAVAAEAGEGAGSEAGEPGGPQRIPADTGQAPRPGRAAGSHAESSARTQGGGRSRSRRRPGSPRDRVRSPGQVKPSRVLSATGRDEAAFRWYAGDQGPRSELAATAPAMCLTCGFMVRLSGPLGQVFGVCANEFAPDDGKVVSFDHGCGAHSDGAVVAEATAPDAAAPTVDELGYDMLNTGATVPDSVLETLDHEQL